VAGRAHGGSGEAFERASAQEVLGLGGLEEDAGAVPNGVGQLERADESPNLGEGVDAVAPGFRVDTCAVVLFAHPHHAAAFAAGESAPLPVADFGGQATVVARASQRRIGSLSVGSLAVVERPPLGAAVEAVFRDDEAALGADGLLAARSQLAVTFGARLSRTVCFTHLVWNFARNHI
jgi:hypothetical protein